MDNQLLRLHCELTGHRPIDIDPTGGAPWMGGPVAITVCDLCGIELPKSETAKQYNREIAEWRERAAMEEEAKHVEVSLGWWTRVVRGYKVGCSCGWRETKRGKTFDEHRKQAGLTRAWSR